MKQIASSPIASPAALASPGSGADTADAVVALRLLATLHESLDPRSVLSHFQAALRAMGLADGLSFTAADHSEKIVLGRQSRCRLVYRLAREQDFFGELSVRRTGRYSEAEIQAVETLSALLLSPLRNAVLYQRALAVARLDALTGVGNRAALDEALQRELRLAHRHGEEMAMIVLDVDDFKGINDSCGHLVGDEVLRCLADVVRCCARQSDLVFRYGGDEFVVIMGHTDRSGASQVAERLRNAVQAKRVRCGGRDHCMQISLGLAISKPDDTPDSLFDRADRALLTAKRNGRNRTVSV